MGMDRRHIAISAVTAAALAVGAVAGRAEIGPCTPADFDLMCGTGNGAARAVLKTLSPSKRLAFAWRLTNRRPTSRSDDNDPNLENFVIRIEDGTVLAKSHGAYWDLGTKIAKAYLMTAWSPDSHLLVKVEQRAESASAELFSFGDNDAAIGPFDLINAIRLGVLAKTHGTVVSNSTLVFAAQPAITIDDQGLMHAAVFIRMEDAADSPPYDVTVQVTRAAGSIDAKVVSVTPHAGAIISIIVH